MAKRKTTKVLALVANGDTGFDARNKINAGLTLTGDLESRIDGKADITYVDSQVSGKVNKAGDTMSGSLMVSVPSGPSIVHAGNMTNGTFAQIMTDDGTEARLELGDGSGVGGTLRWRPSSGSLELKNVDHDTGLSMSDKIYINKKIQGTGEALIHGYELTHKDYVDGIVNTAVRDKGSWLSEIHDWNTFVTPDVIRTGSINGSVWGPNAPIGSGYAYGSLVVFVGNTCITQVYFPHSEAARVAFRVSYDGTAAGWRPWQYLTSSTTMEAMEDRVNALEARLEALEGGANVKTRKR